MFRIRDDIFVHNMKNERDIIRYRRVHVTTVEQDKAHFTKKEIKRA